MRAHKKYPDDIRKSLNKLLVDFLMNHCMIGCMLDVLVTKSVEAVSTKTKNKKGDCPINRKCSRCKYYKKPRVILQSKDIYHIV